MKSNKKASLQISNLHFEGHPEYNFEKQAKKTVHTQAVPIDFKKAAKTVTANKVRHCDVIKKLYNNSSKTVV